MVKGLSKMYNFSFFGQFFYYITGFCDKKFYFCKFASFFAVSKSRAQELSNDVSFVIFGHQTWDLEGGGGQIDLPPSISWFSSTPAGIGLKRKGGYKRCICKRNIHIKCAMLKSSCELITVM